MAAIDVRGVIESSTLLSGLTEDQRAQLAQVATAKVAQKGEVIWLGGENRTSFALIDRGFVKMSRTNSNGTEIALELMGGGQCFGLNGIVDGEGCPLTATAVTKVRYLKIMSTDFMPMYEANAHFKEFFMRRMIRRFHDKLELIARMSAGRVPSRIAAVLLTLLNSYGVEIDGFAVIRVPLTRSEIAEMAGTTTETTIRTLTKWQKEGIVSTREHHIVVCDIEALEKMVD